jgi:hypothetical protein
MQVTKHGGYGAWEAFDARNLYVVKFGGKIEAERGIFRVAIATGEEQKVSSARTDWSRVAVAKDGLYFIEASPVDGQHYLHFLEFRSGETRVVRKLERPSVLGFSISCDSKWFVYSAAERRGSDLMLAEVR